MRLCLDHYIFLSLSLCVCEMKVMIYVLVFYCVSEYKQHIEKVLVKEHFNSLCIVMYNYTLLLL